MVFVIDIEKATIENDDYRRVIYTTKNQQLVLMSIPPNDDIPLEIHPDIDQFIRFESGEGEVRIGKNESKVYKVKDGLSITIDMGTYHHIVNTGNIPLKLYSIYSGPEHPLGLVQKTNPKYKNKLSNYEKLKILNYILF